jgi:hypothetical protein
MPPVCPLLLALLLTLPITAQEPNALNIMSRVATNQDAAQADRIHYIYVQHAKVRSLKGHTVRCEEITDARIVPTEKGYSQQLLKLDGRLLHKGKYIIYNEHNIAPIPKDKESTDIDNEDDDLKITLKDDDNDTTDRDLVENMRSNLTKSPKSKDGLAAGLFPLTTEAQKDYTFELLGRAPMNGHNTFHITFRPKDKDDFGWKGDAYIDATAYQPVLVRTTMARNIPFAVRTLLGTSLPGLGFSVTYEPQPANQPNAPWFPVTFGTEFKLHVLFFFNRQIVIDAHNTDFEKTHVTTTIVPAPTQ